MSENAGRTLRRFPRYQIDIRVRLSTPSSGTDSAVYGRGTDVGEGGMAIFAAIECRIGDSIEVHFPVLSSPQPMKAKGIVRNRNGFRYGIEFVGLSADDRKEVVRLCEFLTPGE